jgi:hypothetical protein
LTTKRKTKTPTPPPKRQRRKATPPAPTVPSTAQLPLNSAIDVRREMAKVYREARGGALEASRAAKFVWMLDGIRRTIETEQLEKTLGELEAAAAQQGLLKR